jgi:hypothetical protein
MRVIVCCAAWRLMYPLREALFPLVCATTCSRDDYDEIVEWGAARLDFPRRCLDLTDARRPLCCSVCARERVSRQTLLHIHVRHP